MAGEPTLPGCLTGKPVPAITERFAGLYAPDEGPVGRFCAGVLWYRPATGIGRKVGVVGRDTGVGMELAVLVVALVLMLLLPSEVRDCGRRALVGI